MNYQKICPICKSIEFVKVDNSIGQLLNSIRTGVFTVAQISRYVCCDCGLIVEWIENRDELMKIKLKY